MDFYQVKGGYNFTGKIKCGGAKNLSTKVMIAALLSDEVSILDNVPNIGDVEVSKSLLESVGAKLHAEKNTLTITPTVNNFTIKQEGNSTYGRIPILLLAVLIHRSDHVSVPTLDGCQFGPRSTNFHHEILKQFGIKIEQEKDHYIASKSCKIKGQKIQLPFPSVGATEFALLLSVLADGMSFLENIAIEPEITSLILMLQQMGAKIQWIGQDKVLVEGVEKLSGTRFRITNDRIEAASWAVLAACSDGLIHLEDVDLKQMSTFLGAFQRMGGGFEATDDGVKFFKKTELQSITVESGPYPAFSTDYQPMLSLMMSQATGISSIHETLFEDRLSHLKSLTAFGVKSDVARECVGNPCQFSDKNHYHSAFICGKTKLTAPKEIIKAENLRSGITYLIAACISKGTSKIGNINLIQRGYENIVERLRLLNVDINLMKEKRS